MIIPPLTMSAPVRLDDLAVMQLGQAPDRNDSAFIRVRPSLATLFDTAGARGSAVMVEPGLYVAHRSIVVGETVQARLSNGDVIRLKVRGKDGCTQLVVLQAIEGDLSVGKPIELPAGEVDPGTPLVIVLADSAIKGTYINSDRLGVLQPSNRLVPLSEIRFEASLQACGGALIFTKGGQFMGALSATLGRSNEARADRISTLQNRALPIQGIADGSRFDSKNFGPAELTVAYTPAIDAVRRAVSGFRSPGRTVDHAMLGILCRDSVGGGALVDLVQPGSPAERAGLRAADVIAGMGPYVVRNQIDFAKIMFRQEPKSKLTLRVRRSGKIMLLDATLGRSSD